jgi:hypothetical protein
LEPVWAGQFSPGVRAPIRSHQSLAAHGLSAPRSRHLIACQARREADSSKGGRAADGLPSKKTGLPSKRKPPFEAEASLRSVMTDGPLAGQTPIRRVNSTVREAIRHPRSQAAGWLGDRQNPQRKAWHTSGLRSSDLSSAQPRKAPFLIVSGPSEMAQKTSQSGPSCAILSHSFVTPSCRLVIHPCCHPINAGFEPGLVSEGLHPRSLSPETI